MKKLLAIAMIVMLSGCAATIKESEIFEHSSVYADLNHLWFSCIGYRDVDVRSVEERTLSIEIYDNRTKELTWVGWSKSQRSGEIKVEKLQEAIRAILAKFPAGSPAPAAAK